jgi:hypothetical protein
MRTTLSCQVLEKRLLGIPLQLFMRFFAGWSDKVDESLINSNIFHLA